MQLSPWVHSLALAASTALTSTPTQAQTAPVEGNIGIKWMNYQEKQDGLDRIRVQARSTFLTLPLPQNWALDATQTVDVISGASPAYYTEPRTFTPMQDVRRAQDLRLSWYPGLQKWSFGQSLSEENDYLSKGVSVSFMQASADRNVSVEVGFSRNEDNINPVNKRVTNQHKTTQDLLLSSTLVLTPNDIVQISLTHSSAKGYLSDPYKFFDVRPDHRRSHALAARWNHRLNAQDATLRLATRLHQDSFGIRSFMLQTEYSQAVGHGWYLTPLVRFYSQSQASFFSPPDPAQPSQPQIPQGAQLGITPLSFDQRLASFGAMTAGLKIEKRLASQTTLDLRWDHYVQSSHWGVMQSGTPGLADFKVRMVQVGISHKF
jgi:hypothetical protein